MIKIFFVFVIMFTTNYLNEVHAADVKTEGKWVDDKSKCLYDFNKDGTFTYYEIDSVKAMKNDSGSNYRVYKRDYTIDMYKENDFNSFGNKYNGVWEKGDGICGAASVNTGRPVGFGNLRLHVDSSVCCLNAKLIGGKLVLEKIIVDGFGGGFYCSNRVLNKYAE